MAWDRNLTDEDRLYIELMTGVYTDKQPDFTWLQPYEEKSWIQYFMPYSQVGYVKNANKEAIVNVETERENTEIILYIYYKGLAYQGLGDEENAPYYLMKATQESSEPQQAFYYNDQQPDKIYYQGLAWRALGEEDKARSRFNKLIGNGEKHLFDTCRIDYFAVSLPDLAIGDDDLNIRNKIHCYYVMGLGHLGLGNQEKAVEFLTKLSELDVNHQGSQIHLSEALKQD